MKKNNLFNLLAIAIVTFLLTACGKDSYNYSKEVYAQSNDIVLEVAVEQIIQKANLSNTQKELLFKDAGKDLADMVKMIMNPGQMGIDLKSKAYFVVNESIQITHFALNDSQKFEQEISKSAQDMNLEIEKKTEGEFKVITIDDITLIFNNKRAAILETSYANDDLIKTIINPQENNLDNYPYSKELNQEGNDFFVTCNYQSINELSREFADVVNPNVHLDDTLGKDFLENTYISFKLTFEKGEINVSYQYLFKNDEVKTKYDQLFTAGKITNTYNDFIAKSPVFLFYVNMLGEKAYANPTLQSALETYSGISSSSEKEALNILGDIIKNMNGDLLFTINNVEINMIAPKVNYTTILTGNTEALYSSILKLLDLGRIKYTQISDNKVSLNIPGFSSYISFNDEFVSISDTEEITKEANNVTGARYYNEKEQTYGYSTLDINKITSDPTIQQMLMMLGAENAKIINQLDYLKLNIPSQYNGNVKLTIKNKESNTLELLSKMLIK